MVVQTSNTQELIQSQIQKILTLPLEQESTFLSSGVKIVDSASPVRFPKFGGLAVDVDYVAEGTLIPNTEVSFSEVTAMPSTLQSFKKVIPVTEEALRTSTLDLSSIIQGALVRALSLSVDKAFYGAGGSGTTTIKGVFAQSGIQTVAAGGKLTTDVVRAAWSTALKSHVDVNSLRLFVTPDDLSALLSEKDNSGRPLLQPDVTQEAQWRLYGVPVVVTDFLPDTTGGTVTGRALLADTSKAVVVRDIQQVVVLKEALALSGQIGLKASARFDLALLVPEAFIAITGITRA